MKINKHLLVAFRLLSGKERKLGLVIILLSFLGGAADVIVLTAIYPLISVITQPDIVQTNIFLHQSWIFAGAPPIGSFVIMLAMLAGSILFMGTGFNILSQVLANRFTALCQERLGHELMHALIEAPYLWHLERNPHILSSLFQNHIVIWGRDVIRRSSTLAGQLAAIILPMIALITWSKIYGMMIIVLATLLFFTLFGFVSKKSNRLLRQKKFVEERLQIFLNETLQGIKDVKLSSRRENFLRNFLKLYHVTCQNFYVVSSWEIIPTQIVFVVGQIGILSVGVILFLSGIQGGALASTLAVVVLVASRVFPAMNRVSAAIIGIKNVSGWVQTLDETIASLPIQPSNKVINDEIKMRLNWNEIKLIGASFTYPNANIPSIRGININILKGKSYAFVGRSGAGKSTLVDVILGLLEPTTGEIIIDSGRLSSFNRNSWMAGIGYVPQLPLISDATLRENIAFGIPFEKIDSSKVKDCVSLAQLSELVSDLPNGLDTPLGDRGSRLSGGQRQRVAIARALYNNPDILVLDEATSALDTLSEQALRESLLCLQGKITIISITHRIMSVTSCDCIFLMEGGQVVASGRFDELMQTSDVFRNLVSAYNSQDISLNTNN